MKAVKTGIVFILAIPLIAHAQNPVQAEDIIDQINAGKAVRYQNAVILGDLDFTSVEDVTPDKPYRLLKAGRFGSTQSYSCHVKSPVFFIDCTFQGDVLAYVHIDRKNETYNVIFYEDVSFEGCEFEKASAFKYVKFEKKANFEKTEYSEEVLFKYTRFSTDVSFAGSVFHDYANFKYTKFPESVDFSNAVFGYHADFKYTKFPEGVNFEDAKFNRFANFKYTKFSEPLNFDRVEFDGDTDFKYTTIDGRSFTSYLLKRKSRR